MKQKTLIYVFSLLFSGLFASCQGQPSDHKEIVNDPQGVQWMSFE